MKRRTFLETLLKKTGLTDDEIKDIIEKLDDEHDDTEVAKLLASLMTADEAKGNDEIFKAVKSKAKADALDPIDTLLKTYVPKLTPAQKTEYDKLGTDSFKKYQYVLKTFDDAGTKTGDKNYDDLKEQFDNLNTSLTTDYVKKLDHDTLQTKLTDRDKELLNIRLLNSAVKSNRLRDVSGDRHFERNFVADAHELLETGLGDKKVKGFVDYATGKIMRSDSPEQPVLVNNKPVLLADLADMTITSYGYEKKSDSTNTSTITVPTTGNKAANAALQSMIAEEQARK